MGLFDFIGDILGLGGDDQAQTTEVEQAPVSQSVNVSVPVTVSPPDVDVTNIIDTLPIASAMEKSSENVALSSLLIMKAMEEDKAESQERLEVMSANFTESQEAARASTNKMIFVLVIICGGFVLLRG